MRVFTDFHHQALYNSLHMLFEERLGGELYRAIGPEWAEKGFWKVYDHPATVQQFLGLQQGIKTPVDVHGNPLPESAQVNKHYRVEDGIYYVLDTTYNYYHRAVTFDKFLEMDWDIIISSIPAHINPFNTLINLYKPAAKHIFQVGNAWGHQSGVRNILSSTAPFPVPAGINICFYHQEFSLDIFKYEPPSIHNVVNSYVHCMKRPELMFEMARLLPEWKFTPYGAGFPQVVNGASAMAEAYKNSAFTWQYKPEGDGFGHGLFSSYACGRPAIIWTSHYQGKHAGQLLEDGVTCIDMCRRDLSGAAQILTDIANYPEKHVQMCQNAYDRFRNCVDFDKEFNEIQGFLNRLQ